jgi:hypothetical protein
MWILFSICSPAFVQRISACTMFGAGTNAIAFFDFLTDVDPIGTNKERATRGRVCRFPANTF